MLGFAAGDFQFTLVNVHLYWANAYLRALETQALGKWAASRVKKAHPPNNDIVLLGDFNIPASNLTDPFFKILTKHGLRLPKHTTNLVGTNLAGDSDYDQIAFFPSRTKEDFTDRMGVFDFDNALFPDLYDAADKAKQKRFFQYIRYYVADHRPLWAEFRRR